MELQKNNNIISFSGGTNGEWKVLSMSALSGNAIEQVDKIHITHNLKNEEDGIKWTLNAFISNLRYTTRQEKTSLDQQSRGLGRPEHNYAALIPIKKSDIWWQMTPDERRKIFEEDSHHIAISLPYVSNISRQLHHSRDLGEDFDFLTWFEFSSAHQGQFNELVQILRQTEEWKYVTREIDIRLERIV